MVGIFDFESFELFSSFESFELFSDLLELPFDFEEDFEVSFDPVSLEFELKNFFQFLINVLEKAITSSSCEFFRSSLTWNF